MQLTVRLETFEVDTGGARLFVLLLADPQMQEGPQRGQDGDAHPHRVFVLRGHDDLDLHRAGSLGSNLLLHPVGNARVHGGPTRQHCVFIEVLENVNIKCDSSRLE